MHYFATLLHLSMLATSHASPTKPPLRGSDQNQIQWQKPCSRELNTTLVPIPLGVVCGSLRVPLDYTDESSNATLDLELIKLPASKTPVKGSILLNFGGPGPNNRVAFSLLSEQLRSLTGGFHNLIYSLPRGSANGSVLPFSCWNKPKPATSPVLSIESINSSDVMFGQYWAQSQVVAGVCSMAQNETGTLIGTAFTARDTMQVVDALGEDGLLRYWGFSAGTTLGNHLLSMFPDKVDKVLLDGVVNPHEYQANRDFEIQHDTDATFSGFFSGCVADPVRCPLGFNRTASDLEEEVWSAINDLKYNPIPISQPGSGYLVDYTSIVNHIFSQLQSPTEWPELAALFNSLLKRDQPELATFTGRLKASLLLNEMTEALFGIKCGDTLVPPATKDEFLQFLSIQSKASRFSTLLAATPIQCAQWQLRAKERYRGNFQVETKNPVLIIGNSFDPVTPLASARNISAGYRGSVVLEHGGYGHCTSSSQASLCTAKAIRSYFVDGIIPRPGTVCDVEAELFSGELGWDKVIKQLEES